ncbi:MAG TPA: hypothetical protein VLB11_02680 [Methyloceanibacter sp.]|nr:hypothetical protein [Methyloceanibacter sp.]
MLMQAGLQEDATVLPVIREPNAWHPVIVAAALRKVVNGLFDAYHPELHYMRGPGPRWREKHVFDLSDPGRG